MTISSFHPAVQDWFSATFERPTEVQTRAWQSISGNHHTLIAAPTGSGKTLAAFLAVINDLLQSKVQGYTAQGTSILYVSPLKALSNDIHRNLEQPLAGIVKNLSFPDDAVTITSAVRSGDTPQTERARMRRQPPDIMVTTPESLFILLTSDSGREMLSTVRTVIIDELHAVISNKRGSHLAVSLERLQALTGTPFTRIGLSATQKPIEKVAQYLVGNRQQHCEIIDCGYERQRDLALVVPEVPLTAIMSMDAWQLVYDKLAKLIEEHKTTLIFVNTRRLAERAARFLAERIGAEFVTAHHGSLAKEHRLEAEQRLKNGELKALVATASLELGIDIGHVDLVCQLGSPRSISTFLQRVGRAGHQINAISKGRLFPLTRDDLVECTALLHAVHAGRLDTLAIASTHLDVLAQHIIAEVGSRECSEEELLSLIQAAWPYRELSEKQFVQLIRMLVDGFTTRRGPRARYLFRDAVNRKLKPRKGAKLTAVTNAGAIPDQFDYDVVLEPDGHVIGSFNEDFAFESLAGDIFQLGNTSYRILQVSQGKVRVVDANGQPPNIPFWFGEAPGRSDELSLAVSELRGQLSDYLQQSDEAAIQYIRDEISIDDYAARQLVHYVNLIRAALGTLPVFNKIIFERFFDDNGDQHLIIHSPYGSRVNRAWGLALRKRFCRQFNFELQAAALDDCIVLSLGATHSFALEDVKHYLKSGTVREVLKQAMLAAPMFTTHWRWNATTALAIKRFQNGNKVPAPFQRSDAEDLMALVFPDQLACQENLGGEREIPDHPLVQQTVNDCLHELMDIETLENILKRIEQDEIQVICKDLSAPSPLAEEILNARPYAFLDDAPAEERRTRSVTTQQILESADAGQLAELDPAAIDKVSRQAWPDIHSVDECHDALYQTGFIKRTDFTEENFNDVENLLNELIRAKRATRVDVNEQIFWVCAEHLDAFHQAMPAAKSLDEVVELKNDDFDDTDRDTVLLDFFRSRLAVKALVSVSDLASYFELTVQHCERLLLRLEAEGYVMRVEYKGQTHWCERGLLARIRRHGLNSLRQQVQTVDASSYMRFLFRWHGLGSHRRRGEDALINVLDSLEGFACPAGVWENGILDSRIEAFTSRDLDNLCTSGRYQWLRLPTQRKKTDDGQLTNAAGILRNTPIHILNRSHLAIWLTTNAAATDSLVLSSAAARVLDCLDRNGASFFIDIVRQSGLLRTQTESALAELAATGKVTSDSFAGLRALITPSQKRPSFRHRSRRQSATGIDSAGRWSLLSSTPQTERGKGWLTTDMETLEHIAHTLLLRYGVVFYQVLQRESGLPPWRELLYVLRRLEARGEIRGGRFVRGFSGEQFALPEAVGLLQSTNTTEEQVICLSACDPLNLVGIISEGERIQSNINTRLAFKNGQLIAKQTKNRLDFVTSADTELEWAVKNVLTRSRNPIGFVPADLKQPH